MSHRLFLGSIFSNARVWAFLKQVDEAEARRWRSAGCPHCGAALHSAMYPRKPHGLAPELRGDARRCSLCCCRCRRRVTPPSARFFGRRFRCAHWAAGDSGGAQRSRRPGRGVPSAPSWRWRRGRRRCARCCAGFEAAAWRRRARSPPDRMRERRLHDRMRRMGPLGRIVADSRPETVGDRK